MKYIIANLKEHQNLTEANTWINTFINILRSSKPIKEALHSQKLRIILAPSAPFLVLFKTGIHEFSGVSLAAQDVSVYEKGSCTGEIGSHALSGIVDYVILGHSERRKFFGETNQSVKKKLDTLNGYMMLPILCVSSLEDMIDIDRGLIAYEPADAIGGGHNYPVETVLEFRTRLNPNQSTPFLYGGSVDENNQGIYLKSPDINGLLIGSASLDAARFCQIVSAV